MAKVKKSFDKELMYKKIMPTNIKKNAEQGAEYISNDTNIEEVLQKEKSISINANTIYINEKSVSAKKDENYEKEVKEVKEVKDGKDNLNFKNKEISLNNSEKRSFILYNIMEKLVMEKLDITLKKMNCCKCDRCKEDIVALALNNLKPMYVVATNDDINDKIERSEKLGLEVTTAVLKAVLAVRKNPRH